MRRAARLRQQHEADQVVLQAWWVEKIRLTTANKKALPAAQDFLRKPGRQTLAEQRKVLRMLSDQYGIPLKVKAPA